MNIKKVIASGTIGLLVAASIYILLTALYNIRGILGHIVGYLVLGSVFTFIVYFLLFGLSLPRVSNYSSKWKIAWFLVMIIFGIWLAINIPISTPYPMQTVSLTIIATGQKNPQAQGNEVMVFGLHYKDGRSVSAENFTLGNGWEIKDGVLVGPTSNPPASLTWSGRTNVDMNLSLLAHPWSGIVKIEWIGTKQTIDLYDANGRYIDVSLPVNSPSATWIQVIFILSVGIGIGFFLFVLSSFIVSRPHTPIKSTNLTSKWRWMFYAAPIIIIWVIYLLAFWPGIMSPDSLDQWGQIVTGNLNDWHPVFHTLMIWLLTRIFYTPASIAVAQIVILGIVSGKILEILETMGISRILCWLTCLLFALSPVNGVMIITLWKDIPYSICILLVTYLFLLIMQTDGGWIKKWQNVLVLGIVSGLIALFRHNGLPVAILILITLLIAYRKFWSQYIVTISIVLLLFFIITGPLYNILHVRKVPPSLLMSIPLHYLGAFVNADVPFSSDEKAVLNSIMSNSSDWEYDCDFANPIISNKNLDSSFITTDRFDVFWTLLSLVIKHPLVAIEHYGCASSLIWRITDINGYVYTNPATWGSFIESNPYNLVSNSKIPLYNSILSKILKDTTVNVYVASFIWRPAIYFYIVLFVILVQGIRQRKPSLFLLSIPILVQSVVLSFLIPVQDFRYQYSIYLVSLMFWTLITL